MNQLNGASHPPAYIIDTTDDASVIDRVQTALGHDPIEIIGLPALKDANDWQTLSRVRMVLTKWSGDSNAPFQAPSRLAAVHLLPVLAVGSRAPDPDGLEALRRCGASAFLDEEFDDQIAAQELLRSSNWFTSPIDRVPVPDTVQILSADDRSGVLVLACPHCRPLAFHSWQQTSGRCTQNSQCTGAVARVYVVGGRLVHAETPTSEGMEAFADCLEFTSGIARFCEVFLPPKAHSLDGTASQLLIRAAALSDESHRDTPTLRPSTPKAYSPATPGRSRRARTVMSKARSHHEQLTHATMVVLSDVDGGVRDLSGEGDGEGLAAVASIMSRAFDQAINQLGLGELEGWTLSGDQASCMAAIDRDELTVAFTSAPQNGLRQLDALLKNVKKSGDKR